MKRPTLRGIFKVLFYIYLAFVLLVACVDVLLGFNSFGAVSGDLISGVLKVVIGLPSSILAVDSGAWKDVSPETARILLWAPILLNLLILGGVAFLTNRHRLHLLLVTFEATLLLLIVDARMAFACSPVFGSMMPVRFWQETVSFLTGPSAPDRHGFECPNIPWVALLAMGAVFFSHLFYLIVLRGEPAVPREVTPAMKRVSAAKTMIVLCVLADCLILGLTTAWTGDLLKGLVLLLVVGGPLTVLAVWRAHLILQAAR